jgi:alanyl-tRNA synthetase
MQTNELREKYLAFFESKGHIRCPSDVLVPTWDPSVLFTPAGMNQFKDHFLGKVKLEFSRATTCQKCLRTGDIENVGRTSYHHTFFEMLGNFSFGDYFKRDAINWAWEFLTEKQWLGIESDRLTVSVYLDDDEAAEIWRNDIKLTPDRIERMDEYDNFWPAGAPSDGPDGVCGPCSEIFYQPENGEEVEIWNLVFTQFNRVGNPPDNLRPLPSKNIDTGMGLERTAATLQGVETNFHIDILLPIVEAAAEICGIKYDYQSDEGRRLRRITDHVRTCTMAVHENVYPGPQKEKYVIRRLLRRASLDGYQMGKREPFLHFIAPSVVEMMRAGYPELSETLERVSGVIRQEEEHFLATLDRAMPRIVELIDTTQRAGRTMIDGRQAYYLYETYGAPPELIESVAEEHGLTLDRDGFKPTEGPGSETDPFDSEVFREGPIDRVKKSIINETEFMGYETTEVEAKLKAIVEISKPAEEKDGRLVESTDKSGPQWLIAVLDRSPFYGESGGQVGDTGRIEADGLVFRVQDTQRDGHLILHYGHLTSGSMRAGQQVAAIVDGTRRHGIRRAHSATHILHHALQKNVGSHAQQQGSKVEDDSLRFDFTNLSAVATDQLRAIEADTVKLISAAEPIKAQVLPLAEARQQGAMMLFGEKYPDPVRMVSMGDFSKELCGGTHLDNTSEVGPFEIISEEGVSAGTRRVVALTGEKAKEHAEQTRTALQQASASLDVGLLDVPEAAGRLAQSVRDLKKQLSSGARRSDSNSDTGSPQAASEGETAYIEIKAALRDTARQLNVAPCDVPGRIGSLQQEVTDLTKQLEALADSSDLSADALIEKGNTIGDSQVIVSEAPGANPNLLRQLIDQLRKKSESSAIFLATAMGDSKVVLVAGVSRDLVERGVSAGDWVKQVAPIVGGGGGGKPDMAQAGGKQPEKLADALNTASAFINEKLGG